MTRLSVFQNITVDGYFVDLKGDMSWAHTAPDEEFDAFTNENAQGSGALVFGRVTYDMMASFWPSEQAAKMMPIVAKKMNDAKKIVFSKKMDKAAWANTTLLKGDPAAEMLRLKKESADDMVIMGSGSIVAQLAGQGLIDEYQLVLNPIALGSGRSMFEGLKAPLRLTMTKARTFANGKVLLCYVPSE